MPKIEDAKLRVTRDPPDVFADGSSPKITSRLSLLSALTITAFQEVLLLWDGEVGSRVLPLGRASVCFYWGVHFHLTKLSSI